MTSPRKLTAEARRLRRHVRELTRDRKHASPARSEALRAQAVREASLAMVLACPDAFSRQWATYAALRGER